MSKSTAYIKKAIARSGGLAAFASSQGVTPQCAYQWRERGRIPIAYAASVARIAGCKPGEICPIWPADLNQPEPAEVA